jgi:capsular polysaccharide biosynthesis protein
MATPKSRYYANWEKRLAAYAAQREKDEAAIAKRNAKALAGKPATSKPEVAPAANGSIPELAKRLRF